MKSQLDTNGSERCNYEKDLLAARAAVADWWADDGDVIDERYHRALTNQQLRIQRFAFSLDQQYPRRSQRWMPVGGLCIRRIWPNDGSELKLSGPPKFGWLKKLKNWKPIPRVAFSQRRTGEGARAGSVSRICPVGRGRVMLRHLAALSASTW